MNWSKYSSLKSGSKVSFEKEEVDGKEVISFVTKRWDASTGEAQADSKREYSLSELESEKANIDSDIARLQAQSDGLAAAIVDYKKL